MRTPCVALALLTACSSDTLIREPADTPDNLGDAGARMPLDAGFVDAATDAGVMDAAAPDATPVDAGEPSCDLQQLGPEDRDRVLLVGQPFSSTPGQVGTEIRSLSLSMSGALADDGVRLDVGFRPARIELSRNGQFALVLGEDGELASVRVDDVRTLTLIDTVTLPSAGYGDLRIWEDGRTVFAVGTNVAETSGISTIHLACDGTLAVVESEFYNVRLAQSLAFLPDPTRAILLGGQTSFEPLDPDDVRLLSYAPGVGWSLIESFDIFADFADALRIAVSPDGSTLVIPNGSPFSSDGDQVSVVRIDGSSLSESVRLMNMEDAREVLFSTDGRTALVSLLAPGRIVVLADLGSGFTEVDRIAGIGLAESMAQVTRGQLTDYVFVSSVDATGEPNVAILRITGAGAASAVGMLNLGASSEDIPGGIAVQP